MIENLLRSLYVSYRASFAKGYGLRMFLFHFKAHMRYGEITKAMVGFPSEPE